MPKRARSRDAEITPEKGATACLFCRIVAGEAFASVVFENIVSVGFLDTRPLFPGHVLLIPRTHYQTLTDLPQELVGPLFSSAQYVARAVKEAMHAEGTFVGMNNTVSQSVSHFHIHIVPRRKGDGLRGFFWPRRPYQGDELKTVHDSLVARLQR